MSSIKIAFLGVGTVGGGTYSILKRHVALVEKRVGAPIEVKRVLVRDLAKRRADWIDRSLLCDDIGIILSDPEISIVLELMGGKEPARAYILKAIEASKHVVTANKLLMALHGPELFAAARERGVALAFEGAVAGGIPIIRAMREGLAGDSILSISGILNGTTNYILSSMSEGGISFERALAEAQAKGYAEADPSSDIEGWDAAYKLSILASLAFEGRVDPLAVKRRGVGVVGAKDIAIAKGAGYAIKLLARAQKLDGGASLSVSPCLVPLSHPLASVNGVFNAICVQGEALGELMLYGQGAGDLPTGSAVVADIIDIARGLGRKAPEPPRLGAEVAQPDSSNLRECRYLRIEVRDVAGVLEKVARALSMNGISVATLSQTLRNDGGASIALFTHECSDGEIARAEKAISAIPELIELACSLPIWAGA